VGAVHVPFESMMGIGTADMSILDSPELDLEWDMPSEPVLLTGDGHCWIALDYRRSGPAGEPSVVWFDNEVGEDLELAPDQTVRRALFSAGSSNDRRGGAAVARRAACR
jgi:hypothetical protein